MASYGGAANPLYLSPEALGEGLDLLLSAHRALAARADAELATAGLGRAHHRALFFVARQPGLTVGDLMALLGITKQSLNRVTTELIARGLVEAKADGADRRRRKLALTAAGREFEERLTAPLGDVVRRAYRDAGVEAVEGFRKVMAGLARGR
jgi:DNA-binding MarR family transcriptional regulator